jgi:hypothetical protein
MKTCTKCNIEKPLMDFYSHPKTQDGKQSSCKKCCIKTQKPHTKKYFEKYPEKFKGNSLKINQWKENNPQYMKEYMIEWRKNNPKYIQIYSKKRKNTDPIFKLSCNIRNLIYESFKRSCKGTYKKSKKTESILDCTIENFVQHLQNQFKPGMTLENHGQGPGKWNIDHIIPISSAKTEEEIYNLNHYTNFQPLWWEENMAKGSKGIES